MDITSKIPTLIPLEVKENKEIECKGLFWRANVSSYMAKTDDKGIYKNLTLKKKLIFLKKRSCKGCGECNFIFDEINDMYQNDPTFIDHVKHGKIYTAKILTTYNYYDGIEVDGIEIVEVKES